MQRYFVSAENWQDHHVKITGDDAHHISRVMRLRNGDDIICNHPDGTSAICHITDVANDCVHTFIKEWLHESTESPVHITIAQALPKSDKFELVLQKGTELGAAAFTPVQAERSVVVWDSKKADKKFARYSKIVKEASEQSHRNKIPHINPVTTISKLAESGSDYDVKLFAYEEEAKTDVFKSFSDVVRQISDEDYVLVCIGPEGGFTEKEAAELKENDFIPVRLGPRILRTETAALYALASISYQLEEMGYR